MAESQADCPSGDGASTRRQRGPRSLWVATFWLVATVAVFSVKLRFLTTRLWHDAGEPLARGLSFPACLWQSTSGRVGLWDLCMEFYVVLAVNVSLGVLWAWIARRGYETTDFGPGLMFLGLNGFQLLFNVFVVMMVCG